MVLPDPALEKQDVIAVGFASEMLWLHVHRHIEKRLLGGCRTVGRLAEDISAQSPVKVKQRGSACMIWNIDLATDSGYEERSEDAVAVWRAAFEAHIAAAANIAGPHFKRMGDELHLTATRLSSWSLEHLWVLRNLTTQEYVRCRPGLEAGKTQGFVDHAGGKWLRIEDVLLLRICWTKPSRFRKRSDTLGSGDDRGKWAGHCFDIIELAEKSLSNWKDITDDIVKEVEQLRKQLDPKWTVPLVSDAPCGTSGIPPMGPFLDLKRTNAELEVTGCISTFVGGIL
ncbi:hypothetical protein MMC13_000953 [Lambiella insularis]|nr:hypothetical protein [Lambiella insularis]